MEPRENRVFYGWYVVAVAFLTNFMATGTGFYIFNALMNPLCDEKGWTRTELNAAPAIGLAVGILSAARPSAQPCRTSSRPSIRD